MTAAPTPPAANGGEALYREYVDNHPTIHSNRFTPWPELTPEQRKSWDDKAAPPPAGPTPERTEGAFSAMSYDAFMGWLKASGISFSDKSGHFWHLTTDDLRKIAAAALSPHAATGGADQGGLHEALKLALREICQREARTVEIREWLQEQTGTGWTCDQCGHFTYHANANECAECASPFPTKNMVAFKLHATITENEEAVDKVWEDRGFDEMLAALSAPPATGGDEADQLIATASNVARSMGAEFVPDPDKVAAFRAGPAPSPTGGAAVAYCNPEHLTRIRREAEARGEAASEVYGYPCGTYRTPLYAAPPAPVEVVEALREATSDQTVEALKRVLGHLQTVREALPDDMGLSLGNIAFAETVDWFDCHIDWTERTARQALARLSGQGAAQ